MASRETDLTRLLQGPHIARIMIDSHGYVRRVPSHGTMQASWARLLVSGIVGFVTAAIVVSCGLALLR